MHELFCCICIAGPAKASGFGTSQPRRSHSRRPFVCSGLAACGSTFVVHPMDLCKVRLQLLPPPANIITVFKSVITKEGPMAIYTGCAPESTLWAMPFFPRAKVCPVRRGSVRTVINPVTTRVPAWSLGAIATSGHRRFKRGRVYGGRGGESWPSLSDAPQPTCRLRAGSPRPSHGKRRAALWHSLKTTQTRRSKWAFRPPCHGAPRQAIQGVRS